MWIEFVAMCVIAGMIGRGLIYKDSGFWTFIGFILLIGLTLIFHPENSFIVFCSLLVVILLIKRLVPNMDPMQRSSKFTTFYYIGFILLNYLIFKHSLIELAIVSGVIPKCSATIAPGADSPYELIPIFSPLIPV